MSPVITRTTIRRNVERLVEAKQLSLDPLIYKRKDPERNSSLPMTSEYHLDRLEIMMESMLESIQTFTESISRRSSLESPPRISTETHELSEDL